MMTCNLTTELDDAVWMVEKFGLREGTVRDQSSQATLESSLAPTAIKLREVGIIAAL